MDIRKCKLFVLTAETGSISKTANMTGYTQSAVSHTLKSLENEVGVQLFIRDRYGVHLTPLGSDFLIHARRLLAENERLEQYIYDVHGLEVGTITIGTFTSISSSWLPVIIKRFKDIHPSIEIIIKEGGFDELTTWLQNMSIDIAFLSKSAHMEMDFIHLAYDPMVAVLPLDYVLQPKAASFKLHDFDDNPFVLLSDGVDYDIRRILESTKTVPKFNYSSQYDLTIMSMVENGLGLSILPQLSFFNIHNPNIKTLPLDPPFYRDLGIGIRSLEATPPLVRSFIYTAQSFFKEMTNTSSVTD